MSKFKVGDEVKVLSVGHFYSGLFKVGDVGEITVNGKDGTYRLNGEGSGCWLCGLDLELVQSKYPNPPHKHCDLQIEKAKGANIECWQPCSESWRVIDKPDWGDRCIYRVAPTKSELADIKTQAKIEKYLAKIEKLKLTLGDR